MNNSHYHSRGTRNKRTKAIAIPSRCDFTIHVGVDTLGQPLSSFKVARLSMTTSSNVWTIDLGRAHDQGEDQIWYRADSPEAFEIILNVIHGKPSSNQKIVSQAVLHQVAKSAARHQVVAELQDFIGSRRELLNKRASYAANRYERSTNFKQRIETAIVFQEYETFDRALTEVVRTTDLGIVSQVIVHPASKRIMARSAPNKSAGKSVIQVNVPGQHHSVFSNEVELQAGTRKAELDKEVAKLLWDMESGRVDPCMVRNSKTSYKCRNALVGSICCGMMVYDHHEFTLEKYAQHLKSVEIIASHAAHKQCVDALDWGRRITRIYERKFGWSGHILRQFPDYRMKVETSRPMMERLSYDSDEPDDDRDFEEVDDSD